MKVSIYDEELIKELENQGVLDQALIIFTTDNGYFHAEHGLADKWYPYQESIRVPLIIRDPRMHKKHIGTTNNKHTLNIDLAPSMLGAAGIAIPNRMQGKDMSLLYTKKHHSYTKFKWRNEFFYEFPDIHHLERWIPSSQALVQRQYKYIL